ncbi:MAG: ribonuclease J [Methyloligellaceae bacterium]
MSGHKKDDKSPELVFLPLGGVGEIGMNLYAYGFGSEYNRQWLVVDLGISFPSDLEPGVDVILPDTKFLEDEIDNIAGIIITHAHEDHYGAIGDLWPRLEAPIYATPFTCGLLKAKLQEYDVIDDIDLHEVKPKSRFDVGPFNIELVNMAHSIPEANGLVIRTEAGTVFHSGDWKLDDNPGTGNLTDEKRLKELGDEGIDFLVCDSTNALSEGRSGSEAEVEEALKEIFLKAENRIAVTTFASNVARLKTVADAAKAADRHICVVGRAMQRTIQVAKETGYLDEKMEFLSEEDFGYFPRNKVVALCTGSQGENRAAMARIANDQHPQITLSQGDLVVYSSKTIPGNEVFVSRVHNSLAAQGVDIITDSEARVHVSGHPRKDELKCLYEWLRPKGMAPMHGEERHIQAHEKFARSLGITNTVIARNGEMARLLPGKAEVIDDAPSGRLFRDGDLIITEEDPSIRERRKLSYTGVVAVSIVLGRNGDIIADPDLVTVGLPLEDDEGVPMEELLIEEVLGVLKSIPRARRKDFDLVAEASRRGVRGAVNRIWGKKPVCEVMVAVI